MSYETVRLNLGRMTDKKEARTLIFNIKVLIVNILNKSRDKLNKKHEVYTSYMRKKGKDPDEFEDRNFWCRSGISSLSDDIKSLKNDINIVNSALSILNNRLVVDFYCSDELCSILNYYEPLLSTENSTS